MRTRVAPPLAAAILLLGGCATSRDRVILLPDIGGGVGKVAVLEPNGETVIAEPYASAVTGGRGGVHTEILRESDVRARYAAELAGLPPRPATYSLYFLPDSPQMTPESARDADTLLAGIAKRPAVEVVLVGHSDTRGQSAHNEQLSLTRAMLVRARLIALGVSAFNVTIAGKGERQPAVPTPDDVQEPRNRRVEVHVR